MRRWGRIIAPLLCFAIGGTLALAEFINAFMHMSVVDHPAGGAAIETLLLHSGLFAFGAVLIAAGFLAWSEG